MKYGWILLLLLLMPVAYASVYMTTDANGHVSYSDMPSQGAEEVAPSTSGIVSAPMPHLLPKANTALSVKPKKDGKEKAASNETQKQPYQVFLIETPKDQENIQNQPVIVVKLKVEPELSPTDKIQLVLDDKPFGVAGTSLNLELANIDRGTHRLYAVLLDERNTVLKRSNEVTIYVFRASINNNANTRASMLTTPSTKLMPSIRALLF